jgi:hypothetical protein
VTTTLDIGFEGYFMCRIATDPDPTNEERGLSGYTMALAKEAKLDQVIRLQVDEAFLAKNGRPPLREMGLHIGVTVRSVDSGGVPWAAGAPLLGARVQLAGKDDPLDGPVFESRNNTTGSDDNMSFVITPFDLRIEHRERGIALRALDYVDRAHPKRQLWQIDDPAVYQRRLSQEVTTGDVEAAQAINVFDTYGYFRDRRAYLDELKARKEGELAHCTGDTPEQKERRAQLRYEIQSYESRIYQINYWGDRVSSKLRTKVSWRHSINGPQTFEGSIGGVVHTDRPWRTSYWFGGWDGDLLTGYLRGSLSVPFTPAS